MKTKFFTLNENGKIEFTEKELKKLLDEIYDDGYADGRRYNWYTYTTPCKNPWGTWYSTTTASSDTYTINTNDTSTVSNGYTTTLKDNDCYTTKNNDDLINKNFIKWSSCSNNKE